MKKYILLAGNDYPYNKNGFDNYINSYDNINDIKIEELPLETFFTINDHHSYEWYQIIDITTMTIIKEDSIW